MARKATTPASVDPSVHDPNVSRTDRPENRETTQNAESFGSEKHMPPAHTARPRSMGESPPVAAVGPRIAEVVIRATVAEPCAARRMALSKKPRNSTETFHEVITSTR